MGTSRRVRGPAAHRAADRAAACKTLSVCYFPCRAPRWRSATRGGASREARRPSIAPYRNGARGVRAARGRDAKPRTAVAIRHARRRDGDIAPYRNGARAVRAAMGYGRCARQRDTGVEHARGAAQVARRAIACESANETALCVFIRRVCDFLHRGFAVATDCMEKRISVVLPHEPCL